MNSKLLPENARKCIFGCELGPVHASSSSSSGGRNEYDLGGIIALLLQDHRTMEHRALHRLHEWI